MQMDWTRSDNQINPFSNRILYTFVLITKKISIYIASCGEFWLASYETCGRDEQGRSQNIYWRTNWLTGPLKNTSTCRRTCVLYILIYGHPKAFVMLKNAKKLSSVLTISLAASFCLSLSSLVLPVVEAPLPCALEMETYRPHPSDNSSNTRVKNVSE